MPKRAEKAESGGADCCGPDCCGGGGCCGSGVGGGCSVEAVVRIDARGQMVLPKEVRASAGIVAGDKIAVVSWSQGDQVCCLGLVRADALADSVRRTYGPLLSSIARG